VSLAEVKSDIKLLVEFVRSKR